jgi:hypothetical protein
VTQSQKATNEKNDLTCDDFKLTDNKFSFTATDAEYKADTRAPQLITVKICGTVDRAISHATNREVCTDLLITLEDPCDAPDSIDPAVNFQSTLDYKITAVGTQYTVPKFKVVPDYCPYNLVLEANKFMNLAREEQDALTMNNESGLIKIFYDMEHFPIDVAAQTIKATATTTSKYSTNKPGLVAKPTIEVIFRSPCNDKELVNLVTAVQTNPAANMYDSKDINFTVNPYSTNIPNVCKIECKCRET